MKSCYFLSFIKPNIIKTLCWFYWRKRREKECFIGRSKGIFIRTIRRETECILQAGDKEEKQHGVNICFPNTVKRPVKKFKKELKNVRTKRIAEETRADERYQ